MNYLHRFNDYKLCKELADKALEILDELHNYAYGSSEYIDHEDKEAVSAAVAATRALWWTLRREEDRVYDLMNKED